MVNIIDFNKRWCNSGFVMSDKEENLNNVKLSLAKALFLQASKEDSNIVLLKIPTKNLDVNKLRYRIQDTTINISIEHAYYGEFATNSKHHTRKKIPIEYIYENDIPMESVECNGKVNFEIPQNMRKKLLAYIKILPLELLKKLLNNQPEQQGVKLAEKSSFAFKNYFA